MDNAIDSWRLDAAVAKRLLLGTTFLPLFAGLLLLVGAVQPVDGSGRDAMNVVGALLVALTCARPVRSRADAPPRISAG